MSLTVIAIGANSYNLVPMPPKPGFADVSFDMNDTVAANVSPFTMQTQTQIWPGGDWWSAQVTMPPLPRVGLLRSAWLAWLAELRGMANVFQLGDPDGQRPQGLAKGQPVVDSSVDTYNLPMTTTLRTRGWTPNVARQLLPFDYLQIGYRLHVVCTEPVSSDSSGDAQITIWPSLRETPADGTRLVLNNPLGLFRLPVNRRSWHTSPKTLVSTGFTCTEAR